MTTPLETTVTDAIFDAFPAVTTRIDGPLTDGTTWMEIIAGAKWIMVEWHPDLPFGVSRVMGSTGFGESSGVYPDEDSAIARILELLAA